MRCDWALVSVPLCKSAGPSESEGERLFWDILCTLCRKCCHTMSGWFRHFHTKYRHYTCIIIHQIWKFCILWSKYFLVTQLLHKLATVKNLVLWTFSLLKGLREKCSSQVVNVTHMLYNSCNLMVCHVRCSKRCFLIRLQHVFLCAYSIKQHNLKFVSLSVKTGHQYFPYAYRLAWLKSSRFFGRLAAEP